MLLSFFILRICIIEFIKKIFRKKNNFFHLSKDLIEIRAFNKIVGIFFLFKLINIFGQTSESTKTASEGFQLFKNFFTK